MTAIRGLEKCSEGWFGIPHSSFLILNSAGYAVACQTPSFLIFATRRMKSFFFMPRR